jgi:hypothetical protein
MINILNYIFVANAFTYFSFSDTQTIKTFRHFVNNSTARFPQKTLHPGVIRTRVFLFLRRMRCPLSHAARALNKFVIYLFEFDIEANPATFEFTVITPAL